MPRPTAAQFAYGSATVVATTLALLLLFRTESGVGVAAVGTTALILGLLVALRLPRPGHGTAEGTGRTATHRTSAAARTHQALEGIGARERVPAARSSARPSARSSARADEHSLRR
ncbi:hypothetical protein [Streptomyces globisporus]|uniref:Uncharacterized protein n=1 Tax=Streptomyces globisporus TaxID=1908 RepID=A0A423USR9_STRGL|nr:hypothetical protein [Streptomyces globisporus]ROV65373.1 hypothetical protein D3105_27840 [Streptomyces globisporus]